MERLASYGMKYPHAAETLPLHILIKMMRQGFGMTQTQLAKRAKLPQSHIAKIELGQVDLQFSTIQKIFQALNCSPLVLPQFKKKPDAIIAEHAKATAKRKVARVSGTMALEKQLPDKQLFDELVRHEEERLRNNPSSEIWEE